MSVAFGPRFWDVPFLWCLLTGRESPLRVRKVRQNNRFPFGLRPSQNCDNAADGHGSRDCQNRSQFTPRASRTNTA
jgi:hypothetical protein